MEKLHFSILINAPKEKVFNTMLELETYKQWAGTFMEGSFYKGSWDTGSRILFLATEKSGKDSGLIARVKENRKNEFVSLEYVGEVKEGVEDTVSESVKNWSEAYENYTFTSKGDGTEISIDLNTPHEWKDMMTEAWPKALEKLKEICES